MNLKDIFTHASWWGKIIGAILGFLAAGPLGALFGILVGNFFDRGISEHLAHPYWYLFTENKGTIQKIFFQTTFTAMGYIAKADGRVSQAEINIAKQLMAEMQLDKEHKKLAQDFFRQGKEPLYNINSQVQKLREVCYKKPQLLKLFLDIQYRAAAVDGLTPKKVAALNNVFQALGFAPLNQQHRFYDDFHYHKNQSYTYKQHKNNNQSYQAPPSTNYSLTEAYALLEVSPKASRKEVKKAYRKLISQNHPDKLIAEGLPEEMIKMANNKTHQIIKAYELICKTNGWPS